MPENAKQKTILSLVLFLWATLGRFTRKGLCYHWNNTKILLLVLTFLE